MKSLRKSYGLSTRLHEINQSFFVVVATIPLTMQIFVLLCQIEILQKAAINARDLCGNLITALTERFTNQLKSRSS